MLSEENLSNPMAAENAADLELRIDGFKLSELGLDRAAEYVKMLSQVLGSPRENHLLAIKDGSLCAAVRTEPGYFEKTLASLHMAGEEGSSSRQRKSFERLNAAIAKDGGVGKITNLRTGSVVLVFPGAKDLQPVFPAFYEQTTIRGKLSQLGEKVDGRYTGQIRDAKSTFTFTCDEQIAHKLRSKLWSYVELAGNARWERNPRGEWRLLSFAADHFRELHNASLSALKTRIRDAGGLKVVQADGSDLGEDAT